ncbi:UNVERIFIED_CONTAM: hypothetical protein PYX00_003209 [Menopon gallinae]
MAECLLHQFIYFIRSLIDKLIDWFFGFFIYDDSQKKILPKVKNPLVLESAVSLARKIRNKEVKSRTVVAAYIERIEQVNPFINAMVDNRFDLALKEAEEVDDFLSNNTYSLEELENNKPFLGVPFTTKESVCCEGLSFTFGMLSRRKEKGTEDAELVRLMKEAGGILLGVTNIPELNLWCETRNNLFGQTLNPYNTTRTVGGSSGGEAAIITSCGSPIGIGTDIGGSVRMPAFYCGLFGHKPTTDLTPMKGTTRRTGEEKNSMVTAGTITRHSEDIIPFLKVLVKDKLSLLTLDKQVNMEDLRIYYVENSNDSRSSRVCPELIQALRKAVNYLEEVSKKPSQEVDLDGTQYSYRLWRYWLSKEPYQFEDELGNREKRVNVFRELPLKLIGKSDFTLAAIFKLIDHYLPKEDSIWAELTTETLRSEICDILDDGGVLLYPSHPFPANYHYSAFLRPFNFGSWAIFNVLKLPVTQVPLGLSKDGLPMGIQVVAGPYKDHISIAVARELEKAFYGWVPPFPVK